MQNSTKFDFDLIVIGAGSGGVRASRIAAQLGARVAVVEGKELGGTCVNLGCVPKKLFVFGSEFQEASSDAYGFGWNTSSLKFNWERLRDNKDREITRLNDIYENILQKANVTLIRGWAKIEGPNHVFVNKQSYSTERILVAVGGEPIQPDFTGADLTITSDEVFHLKTFPKHIVIVGGGYIATEFSGIFSGFGAEVVQIYRGPLFLRGFDETLRQGLADEMQKKIDLRFNTNISKVTKKGTRLLVSLHNGSEIETDLVMSAIGRKPLTADLGLSKCGVNLEKNGSIIVNDEFQTSVPSIYAIGDVIDRKQLTPVALAEGMALAHYLYGSPRKISYKNIPTAIFSQPNIGTVGLTEEEARKRYGTEITLFQSTFTPMKLALTNRSEKTIMKLIVHRKTDRVLGVHMMGSQAGEIIQGFAVALNMNATKADFDRTIGIHPTTAEEFVTMRNPRNDN